MTSVQSVVLYFIILFSCCSSGKHIANYVATAKFPDLCRNCELGQICNPATGLCPVCMPGWKLPDCQKACDDGMFGPGCTSRCGHCGSNLPCNKENGGCLSCERGWQPPNCRTRPTLNVEGEEETRIADGMKYFWIIGGIVITLVILFCLILWIVGLRSKGRRDPETHNNKGKNNIYEMTTDSED